MTDELVILRSFVIVLVIVLSLEFCVGIWMLKGFIFEWTDKKIHAKESKSEKSLKKRSKKHSSCSDCDYLIMMIFLFFRHDGGSIMMDKTTLSRFSNY